jgi:hypothetical protein
MLRSRHNREQSNVSRARQGAARGLERAASAVDVDAGTPKKRRRKPVVLAALAGIGAWLVAKSRKSPEQVAGTTEKVADKVASGARRAAASAEKVSAKAAAKAQPESVQPQPARAGNSTR